MKQPQNEDYASPQTSLQAKINQYDISDISDILDKEFIFKDRATFPQYISKTVRDQWAFFCKCNQRFTQVELTEKVLIYAMVTIPSTHGLIEITIPDKSIEQQTIEDRMNEIQCIAELKMYIGDVIDIKKRDREIHPNKLNTLSDIIKKCQKINNRSDRLNELIKEVLDLVE